MAAEAISDEDIDELEHKQVILHVSMISIAQRVFHSVEAEGSCALHCG